MFVTREDFIRPSSFASLEACPGKPTMEARACALVPGLADLCGEPARQGTLGHAAIAGVARDAFAGDWSQAQTIIAGLEARMGGLSDWTKGGVRACVRYLVEQLGRLLRQFTRLIILEERHLDGSGIATPRGGTADLIVLCYDASGLALVVVMDWKLGWVSQGEAADNLQLGGYGAMAWDFWRPPLGVEVHLAAGRRGEFSSAIYDTPAIAAVRLRILHAIAAARDPAAELRPCVPACRWCKALPLCRPAREFLMTAADDHALFGAAPEDRVALAEAAQLAKRFAASADALAKLWREQEAERATFPTHPAGTAGTKGNA